mgnify:CR=1 FL=1
MQRRIELKVAIIRSGRRAYEVARMAGTSPEMLSKIIAGVVNPTEEMQLKLSIVLDTPTETLFPALTPGPARRTLKAMDPTIEQVIQAAPVHPRIGDKVAHYCTECPWWTSDHHDCKPGTGENAPAVCPKCRGLVRWLPLTDFVDLMKDRHDVQGFERFVSCHHGHSLWPAPEEASSDGNV